MPWSTARGTDGPPGLLQPVWIDLDYRQVAAKNLAVLADDKHLQSADNVVPIGRQKALTTDSSSILNRVSAKLTTEDLLVMNRKSSVDKADPDTLASDWLKSHGFKT